MAMGRKNPSLPLTFKGHDFDAGTGLKYFYKMDQYSKLVPKRHYLEEHDEGING
jgi:hypothetical protein